MTVPAVTPRPTALPVDDALHALPVDLDTAGNSGADQWLIPLPAAPDRSGSAPMWTALFLAFLHGYTGATEMVLVRQLPGSAVLSAYRFEVRADDSVTALARHALDVLGAPPAGAVLAQERGPAGVLAGVPQDDVGHPADLGLVLTGSGAALSASAARWNRETAENMAARLAHLAESASNRPGQAVRDLPLLPPGSYHTIVCQWNDTSRPVPPQAVDELIWHQASATPSALALEQSGDSLSYAELGARADRLAGYLVGQRLAPETIVALCLEPSPELVVAMLGVMRAGCAFLALDLMSPPERLAQIVLDSGAPLLLSHERTRTRLAGQLPGVVFCCLDDESWRASPPVVRGPAAPGALACVFYTSGSTGGPKGVMFTHFELTNFAVAMKEVWELGPADRILQLAPAGFDVLLEEVLPVLLAGGAVVLPARPVLETGEDLTEIVDRNQITGFEITAPYWQEWVLAMRRPLPASLRFVAMGGERVNAELLAAWRRLGLPLVHVYGLTEATVTSTVFRLAPGGPEDDPAALPIGRPLPNVHVYVLDPYLRPVPVGQPGELHIGGGLARGYLHRPGLTAERFIPSPFGPPGGRLYRTGDLARWLPDGTLEFIGRTDDQVKVRGFRIELAEIQDMLVRHPSVAAALAVIREDRPGDKRLVAYLVGEDGAARPSTADLRTHLTHRVPDYMQPAAFVFVDAFPLTVTGKYDRKSLPLPVYASPGEAAAPGSGLEDALCRLFAEVLGLPAVGAHDDFFDLGGHSLLALRLKSRIAAELQQQITVRDVFERPSASGLAGALAARSEVRDDASAGSAAQTVTAATVVRRVPARRADPARSEILLTGATGYFGAFLLDELLANTPNTINCLVRATSQDHARRRVQENLRRYERLGAAVADRVKVTVGDLAAPRLGLSRLAFARLARRTGAIYHNGALVNALLSVSQLKAANVDSTLTLIQLATKTALKELHFVSTDSAGLDLESGYERSKKEAEQLVHAAAAQGVPTTIYRLPRLAPDSRTGIANENDIMVRMLDVMLEVGAAPDLEFSEIWVPVDHAARALVQSARGPRDTDSMVLTSETSVSLSHLVEVARESGCTMATEPLDQWIRRVNQLNSPHHQLTLAALGLDGVSEPEPVADPADHDDDARFGVLAATGVDQAALGRYLTRRQRPGNPRKGFQP